VTAPSVLIVDQGASFGGSVLVAATILDHMSVSRYRVLLVTAAGPDALSARVARMGSIIHLAKPYTYLNQDAWRQRLAWLPGAFDRPRNWLESVLRFVRNSGYLAHLVRIIQRERIAIVHLNNGFENLEAHLAAALTGRPILIHAHGGTARSRLIRRLARGNHPAVAISGPVGESLKQAGVPEARIATLHNPLTLESRPLAPAERDETRFKHGIPTEAVTVAILGRIVRWKGQAQFLRAFARCAGHVEGAFALVIGDVTDGNEPYREELDALVRELGISDRVRFTGFIADPREAYGLADIVVHASIEPEPFGLVLTEAMALGIPVVAAAAGGPLEIITDGVDGFLRSPENSASLAAVLTPLLSQADLRATIGAAGRATAIARFGAAEYVERMAALYDSMRGSE